MKLVVHAPNVHQGGGRTLLLALLQAARSTPSVGAVVDARLPLPTDVPPAMVIGRVEPGLRARIAAEWRLRSLVTADDAVLCFGNLPPLFGVRGRVFLFLQNRYVVGRRPTRGLPAAARARIEVERAWLRARLRAVHSVIVQTASMAHETEQELGVRPVILPFSAVKSGQATGGAALSRGAPSIDFLYVSSGEPHKNHRTLLAAWRRLAAEGVYPSLRVTVSRDVYPELCAEIDHAASSDGVNVENAGAIEPPAVEALYASARAVIYPSRFESFGLPLLEAQAHGLPILAAELDYVRDVMDPVETFDPESPVSIARAVRRYCGRPETRPNVLTPDEFLARLMSGTVVANSGGSTPFGGR